MEVEDSSPRSPFWLQTTTTSRIQRYRRSLSSLFFNSFVLIICLLLFAIASMAYIIIPSIIIHHSSPPPPPPHMLSFFKTSSINLFLVSIALLFGFLARNINNDQNINPHIIDPTEPEFPPIISPETLVPHQRRYDLHDHDFKSNYGLTKQRTSSSYPDLRQLSPTWNHSDAAVDPWRFPDDTHLNYYQLLESNSNYLRHRSRRYQSSEMESSEKKGGRVERKRGTGEKRRARSSEPRRVLSPVIDQMPELWSPPPDSPLTERKRNGGNTTKDFFSSFYHKKKNKLQRGRSVDNLGALLPHSQPLPLKFKPLIPDSQPLPEKFKPLAPSPSLPSPSVINNLIQSKKGNKKKFLSVPFAPSAPPSTPPPLPIANRAPRPNMTRVAPFVTDRPKVPLMLTGLNGYDDSSSGGESPMKNIPPPPPLPPFKMSDWKFAVEGDFVRLQSTLSSRSVSPDGEEAQSPSSDVDAVTTALTPPLFSPNPDVDTKADSFIARFRAGLKLERMSKLGPGPDLDPSAS